MLRLMPSRAAISPFASPSKALSRKTSRHRGGSSSMAARDQAELLARDDLLLRADRLVDAAREVDVRHLPEQIGLEPATLSQAVGDVAGHEKQEDRRVLDLGPVERLDEAEIGFLHRIGGVGGIVEQPKQKALKLQALATMQRID